MSLFFALDNITNQISLLCVLVLQNVRVTRSEMGMFKRSTGNIMRGKPLLILTKKKRSGQKFITYGIDFFGLHNMQTFEDLKALPICNNIMDKV